MEGCDLTRDVDVERRSDALANKRILFGITGGIAATEAVRIARELRRHGAEITVLMTPAATKVITPLAVGWAAQVEVGVDFEADMAQLDAHDGILICPASRNFLARLVHGMMDHPLLMACAAARGRDCPVLVVPSMHNDLFDDPVTADICEAVESQGIHCSWGPEEEGRRKQPGPVQVVADLCHVVNQGRADRRRIAITLGANRAPIDAVRAIQNASSGATGWTIAEHLHRMGHQVVCIAGKTSADPSFILPDVRRAGEPDAMLATCLEVVKGEPDGARRPDGWVHAAAVLDYFAAPEEGKRASGEDDWSLTLLPGPKHIRELMPHVGNARRIGFKLEVGIGIDALVDKARAQIDAYGVDATVANLKSHVRDESQARAHLVHADGRIEELSDEAAMCAAIEAVLIS